MQISDYLPKLETLKVKKGPRTERELYIQDIAELTGMTTKVIFWKVNHIPRNCDHWLKEMYLEAMNAPKKKIVNGKYVEKKPEELKISQCKLFWHLLKKTK